MGIMGRLLMFERMNVYFQVQTWSSVAVIVAREYGCKCKSPSIFALENFRGKITTRMFVYLTYRDFVLYFNVILTPG